MIRHRFPFIALLVVTGLLAWLPVDSDVGSVAETLPDRLSDQEFWKLSADLSEPNGTFRSDNLLSNELWFQHVVPELGRKARTGRVYLGVGPEQNFTYIGVVRPKMVFIVDIRRGNLQLHLMYKALFEMSADRAEFYSRLFSKKRPDSLGRKSTIEEIVNTYATLETSDVLHKANLKAIEEHLTGRRGLPLSNDDISGIKYVYDAFYSYGPSIQYSSTGGRGSGRGMPATYADLLVATDADGRMHGYLASEENFAFLKDLHSRNVFVPVVGNFAGPKALRAVGHYLKEKGAAVSAFYLSNVEQYLYQQGVWQTFCANVATLPLDDTSVFIRSVRTSQFGAGMGLNSELGDMAAEVKDCR
jgi:hypothetical protein